MFNLLRDTFSYVQYLSGGNTFSVKSVGRDKFKRDCCKVRINTDESLSYLAAAKTIDGIGDVASKWSPDDVKYFAERSYISYARRVFDCVAIRRGLLNNSIKLYEFNIGKITKSAIEQLSQPHPEVTASSNNQLSEEEAKGLLYFNHAGNSSSGLNVVDHLLTKDKFRHVENAIACDDIWGSLHAFKEYHLNNFMKDSLRKTSIYHSDYYLDGNTTQLKFPDKKLRLSISYNRFLIAKKDSSKLRLLSAPEKNTKELQNVINNVLSHSVYLSPSTLAYVPGKDHIEFLKKEGLSYKCNKQYDLKDYFHQIKEEKLHDVFEDAFVNNKVKKLQDALASFVNFTQHLKDSSNLNPLVYDSPIVMSNLRTVAARKELATYMVANNLIDRLYSTIIPMLIELERNVYSFKPLWEKADRNSMFKREWLSTLVSIRMFYVGIKAFMSYSRRITSSSLAAIEDYTKENGKKKVDEYYTAQLNVLLNNPILNITGSYSFWFQFADALSIINRTRDMYQMLTVVVNPKGSVNECYGFKTVNLDFPNCDNKIDLPCIVPGVSRISNNEHKLPRLIYSIYAKFAESVTAKIPTNISSSIFNNINSGNIGEILMYKSRGENGKVVYDSSDDAKNRMCSTLARVAAPTDTNLTCINKLSEGSSIATYSYNRVIKKLAPTLRWASALPQGSPASGFLANIYGNRFIKSVEEELSKQGIIAKVYMYSDNFYIFFNDVTEADNVDRIVEAQTVKYKLDLNKSKTQLYWGKDKKMLGFLMDDNGKIRVNRKYVDAVNQIIIALNRHEEINYKGTVYTRADKQVIQGMLGWVHHVGNKDYKRKIIPMEF
jgi:hypothetical protein